MNHTERKNRHRRIRAKVHGTAEKPRASVFRGNRVITVQLVDDVAGKTLAAVSASGTGKSKMDAAQEVGKQIAQQAKEKGITHIVFDRGGFRYQGRVKAIASAMREAGLEF
ncbi:MAG: 50S ribosomal protein L18 [Candidatus Andersenbacteria bacterium]